MLATTAEALPCKTLVIPTEVRSDSDGKWRNLLLIPRSGNCLNVREPPWKSDP
jgi:hypothetical protein